MNCSICHKPVTELQSSIDHIRPNMRGGLNTTTVHMHCNRSRLTFRKRMAWRLGYWRYRLILLRDRLINR